jgi:hypothetical protein
MQIKSPELCGPASGVIAQGWVTGTVPLAIQQDFDTEEAGGHGAKRRRALWA